MHELAVKTYGMIDVVVPNAGVREVEDIFEDKYDENGRLLPPKHILNEINLKGVFNSIPSSCLVLISSAVKLAIHFFRKLQRKGVIVMISSTAGYMGEPIPGYSAAKHGVLTPVCNMLT
jgi:NAD(P)-dependent dehydrogenase (short-subunit alcohol dehydrogenase family)